MPCRGLPHLATRNDMAWRGGFRQQAQLETSFLQEFGSNSNSSRSSSSSSSSSSSTTDSRDSRYSKSSGDGDGEGGGGVGGAPGVVAMMSAQVQ
jgi:hypothetical protein